MPGFFIGKQMVGKRILQFGILLLIVLKLLFFTLRFPKQFYTDPISLENPTINSQASNYVTDSPTIKLQIILRCFFCVPITKEQFSKGGTYAPTEPVDTVAYINITQTNGLLVISSRRIDLVANLITVDGNDISTYWISPPGFAKWVLKMREENLRKLGAA